MPSTRSARESAPRCAAGAAVGLRVTLQRANYRELPRFVTLARELGVSQVSFLAVDVSNPHAFARSDDFSRGLALEPTTWPNSTALLDVLEREHAADFRGRFIAESPAKLRACATTSPRCAAWARFHPCAAMRPEFSAVVGVDGARVAVLLHSRPGGGSRRRRSRLRSPVAPMVELRRAIRAGERRECRALRVLDVSRAGANSRRAASAAEGACRSLSSLRGCSARASRARCARRSAACWARLSRRRRASLRCVAARARARHVR